MVWVGEERCVGSGPQGGGGGGKEGKKNMRGKGLVFASN